MYVCVFLLVCCGCFYFGVTVVSFVVGLFLSGQDTVMSALQGAPGYFIVWAFKRLITMATCVHVYYVCFCLLLVFVVVVVFSVTVVSFVVGLFLSEQVTVISVLQGVSGYPLWDD